MSHSPDRLSGKDYLLISGICLLCLLLPSLLTHVRTEDFAEEENEKEDIDARGPNMKQPLSLWSQYTLKYKNPMDFLYPDEREGFSFFRYRQGNSPQDMLPSFRPEVRLSFLQPGLKEQEPETVMPAFPLPELDPIDRTPVYPKQPDVVYPAVFSVNGEYLGHLNLETNAQLVKKGSGPIVFTVIRPILPDLPRMVQPAAPDGNYQELISQLNQKLIDPEFLFCGDQLIVFTAPPEIKEAKP